MSRQETHDVNVPESGADDASQQAQGQGLSRRNLLAGSGWTDRRKHVGASAVVAQSEQSGAGSHFRPSGSLASRIFSANPTHPSMNDMSENPANVPPSITRTEPGTVRIELETIEIEAHLDTNSRNRFSTFNSTAPGRFQRVRVGDTVELYLKTNEDSWFAHNVDFNAVKGPGGGASLSAPGPGENCSFKFKAQNSSPYVYHCAVAPVALHIANGMYGLILVEPEAGPPPVDREFHVMQGEIHTGKPFGSVGAFTDHYPLQAKVDETIRIYFRVGGPNYTSAFHVIGEIFDKAYLHGSLVTPPLESAQTIVAPPGSSGIVEFRCEAPGRFVIVNHALSRAERGLAGYLFVEGDENPDVFPPLDKASGAAGPGDQE